MRSDLGHVSNHNLLCLCILVIINTPNAEAVMALKKKTGNKKQSKPLVYVLEGVFGALAMSLGLVALAALLMQKQILPIESTRILNPAVKAFCALFAALLGARKQKKRRWLTGALCGVVYIVISLAVFGLASGEFSIGSSTAVDALMCLLARMTGGIILSLVE